MVFCFFFFFIDLDPEFHQDIFSQDDYHYLNVPVVGSFTVDNTFDCTLKCLRNPCCFSVNLAAYRGANGKIWCELLSSEKHSNPEKYKRNQTSHHLSTILEVQHYHYQCYYYSLSLSLSSSSSSASSLSLLQEPITRSEQLPYQAYVTAFLRTSLLLDTFQGTFSRENRISTMSMSAFEV